MRRILNTYLKTLDRDEFLVLALSVSFAAAAISAYAVYLGVEIEIGKIFPHRAIGGASVAGLNSGIRSEVFWRAVTSFCLVFVLSTAIVTFLLNKVEQLNLVHRTVVERGVLLQSSLLFVPCLVLEVLHYNYAPALKILAGIVAISAGLILVKIVCARASLLQPSGALCQYRSMLFVFSGLSAGYYAVLQMTGDAAGVRLLGNHSYVLFAAALFAVVFVHRCYGPRTLSKISRFFLPLVLLPLLQPISCELQYWLTEYLTVDERIVYGTVSVLLVIFSIVWCIGTKSPISQRRLTEQFLFPAILITYVVYVYWKPQIVFPVNDLLHPGNFIVPAKQWLRDGSIPFVEFWPDLGMQATVPSAFYTFIFGDQGLDGLLYNFLPRIIGCVGVYLLLSRFFSSQWAFLSVLLLPIVVPSTWISPEKAFWFPNRVSYAVVVILCIGWVMRRMTLGRLSLLWVLVVLSVAWLPSTGKALLFSVLVLMAMRVMAGTRAEFGRIVLSFVLVSSLVAVVYCTLVAAKGYPIKQSFQYVLTLGLAEKYVFSRPHIITGSINGVALFYYAITPMLLLAVNGSILWQVTKGRLVSPKLWMLSGLTLFSLFGGVRALHRHSLVENYFPLFFILAAAITPHLFWSKPRYATVWATLVFTASALCLPAQSRLDDGLHVETMNWMSSRPHRVIPDDPRRFQLVADFLRRNLGNGQTYLEFVHGHLLYALSGHQVPPFHRAGRILSTEDAQLIYLDYFSRYYHDQRVPFVILDGTYWGSHIDGIPTPMALFRIAEFINSHYTPVAEISGLRILKANNHVGGLEQSREFQLTSVGFDSSQKYSGHNVKVSATKHRLEVAAEGEDPYLVNVLKYARHPIRLQSDGNYFVRLRLRSSTDGEARLYLGLNNNEFSEENSVKVAVHATEKYQEYVVGLPHSASGQTLHALRLDLPPRGGLEISWIEIFELLDDKFRVKSLKRLPQNFPLKNLAYLWANGDENKSWRDGTVLHSDDKPVNIPGKGKVALQLPALLEKQAGNYLHFRIRSTRPGKMKLAYGGRLQSTVTFNVLPSNDVVDYVIRISSQWAWLNEDTEEIVISGDHGAELISFSVLKAD